MLTLPTRGGRFLSGRGGESCSSTSRIRKSEVTLTLTTHAFTYGLAGSKTYCYKKNLIYINKPYFYSARQQKKALTTPHSLSTSTSTPILATSLSTSGTDAAPRAISRTCERRVPHLRQPRPSPAKNNNLTERDTCAGFSD